MKKYKLSDFMSPEGDIYQVDEETGETWMLDEPNEPIQSFVEAAFKHGTTQFEQMKCYAAAWGTLEEVV
jgi:hypothetical protein